MSAVCFARRPFIGGHMSSYRMPPGRDICQFCQRLITIGRTGEWVLDTFTIEEEEELVDLYQ